ncbi:MAG: DUF2911 domain-containing protein [Bacteroidetes bacterium]|jgi:tetratricopeptide (TPR) repeat protein|nr:DUF2911 domain-containing protein [Bacteroidota bacterium]
MKKFTTIFSAVAFLCTFANAQFVNTPPASKKAAVTEYIGLSKIHISYHRPGVKGREGKVYGNPNLVPYDGQPTPWRAGANDNTIMYFGDDVQINGQDLPAGKYGFHIIPRESGDWTLIFSNNNWSWGSYAYDEAEDALRVNAKASDCDHVEWLTYEFINQTDNSADIRLSWESKSVTFSVSTDLHATTMKHIESEIEHLKGFSWQGLNSAAQFAMNDESTLEKALGWADQASGNGFGAQKNFQTLSTKAQILDKMGKSDEAKTIMEKALALGSITDLHFYARSLIQAKKPKEALEIFEMNAKKNPDDNFTIFVGLARGNMAIENYESAAKYFKKAAPNAPQGQEQAYMDLAKQCEQKMTKGD